jgi:hypothetical protein
VETAAPLRSRSFVLLTLSYSLQGYVGYIFVFWFYLYLVQERHFDLLKGAVLSSLPWLLSIVSIPLGGWISDRIAARHGLVVGRRAVPLVGLALAGVFLSLGARTTNGYLAAVSLALSTALVLCVEGPFWATMTEIAGGRSGLAGGIMNTGATRLVSPALTPVLAAAIGWENASTSPRPSRSSPPFCGSVSTLDLPARSHVRRPRPGDGSGRHMPFGPGLRPAPRPSYEDSDIRNTEGRGAGARQSGDREGPPPAVRRSPGATRPGQPLGGGA